MREHVCGAARRGLCPACHQNDVIDAFVPGLDAITPECAYPDTSHRLAEMAIENSVFASRFTISSIAREVEIFNVERRAE